MTISGVGKKTAERICVELKDKVGSIASVSVKAVSGGRHNHETSAMADALSALMNLGYSDPVARAALAKVKERAGDEAFAAMAIEQLIKEGLGAVS
jgi:Holliday junction DNA helicase RuvA